MSRLIGWLVKKLLWLLLIATIVGLVWILWYYLFEKKG